MCQFARYYSSKCEHVECYYDDDDGLINLVSDLDEFSVSVDADVIASDDVDEYRSLIIIIIIN